MHAPSWVGLLIVLGLAFLLFGRPGRISGLMEDLGKGIRGFRRGLDDNQNPPTGQNPGQPQDPPRQIRDQSATPDDTRTRTDDRTGV